MNVMTISTLQRPIGSHLRLMGLMAASCCLPSYWTDLDIDDADVMDVADVIVACPGRQDVGRCPRPHPPVHKRLCGRAAAKGSHQNGNNRPACPSALQRCASPKHHNFTISSESYRVQITARPGLFYAVPCCGNCRGSTWLVAAAVLPEQSPTAKDTIKQHQDQVLVSNDAVDVSHRKMT